MDDHTLLMHPTLLSNILSFNQDRQLKSRWELLRIFHLGTACALVIRSIALAILPASSNSPCVPSWLSSLPLLQDSWLILFVLMQILSSSRSWDQFADSNARSQFAKRGFLVESGMATIGHALTANPHSDVIYCLLPALATNAYGLPLRNALRRLRAIPLCVFLSAVGSHWLSDGSKHHFPIVLVNNVLPRSVFLVCLGMIAIYIVRVGSAEKAIATSVHLSIPDGLAVVDAASQRICWANNEMCNGFGNSLGQSLHPSLSHEVPATAHLTPPNNSCPQRVYQISTCPLHISNTTIGEIWLARDITTSHTLGHANLAFQRATSETELWDVLCKALAALGYKRSRVYRWSKDHTQLEGVADHGMQGINFRDFPIPFQDDPYSARTLASEYPIVYAPNSNDHCAAPLGKDTELPWLEVPMRHGGTVYGKISLDNKGHINAERACLREEMAAQTQSRHSELLIAVNSLSIQASHTLHRLIEAHARADALAAYLHYSARHFFSMAAPLARLSAVKELDIDPSASKALEYLKGMSHVLRHYSLMATHWARQEKAPFGQILVERVRTDLQLLLRDLSKWFSFLSESTAAKLQINLEGIQYANIDRGIAEQVLNVLLNNAFDALARHSSGTSPGLVDVFIKHETIDTVEFIVRDNGVGMTHKQLSHLFVPRPIRAAAQRLGMGLRIATYLCDCHGGKLWCSASRPLQGAEFRFTLCENPMI